MPRAQRRRMRSFMSIAMWMLAGGTAGWIGFVLFGFNAKRGLPASIVTGALAGWLGGGLLAPMVAAGTVVPGEFNPFSMFAALAAAAGCLIVGEMIYRRFGI
jgi:uncharacterized membrane protein YeaQ/YmgE (transglycosylase-associated protein family)